MPDLPPLNCFPRLAANLALQLPFSTLFQLAYIQNKVVRNLPVTQQHIPFPEMLLHTDKEI